MKVFADDKDWKNDAEKIEDVERGVVVEAGNNAALHVDTGNTILLDCVEEDAGQVEVVEGAVREKENVGDREAIW